MAGLPEPSPAEIRTAAARVLDYLAETDAVGPDLALAGFASDAIIGFGVFDRRLPRFCGELYTRAFARRIIFTGGFGAGTGDLGGAEADVWRDELRRSHPAIPDSAVILENRSTNTAENIRFTAELLAREYPALAFGLGIRHVTIVASPSRLRRVRLTLAHLAPQLAIARQLPPVSFESEAALYARNGIDYLAHLCGELDRLVEYPNRGWIAFEPLPPEIVAAHTLLRRRERSRPAQGTS